MDMNKNIFFSNTGITDNGYKNVNILNSSIKV
jgi:hypothetical protein